jgi:hypothetical protein
MGELPTYEFKNVRNKLECLFIEGLSGLVKMFAGKAEGRTFQVLNARVGFKPSPQTLN